MTVVSRHIGRLGNNMFQIAAAMGYARKYGYQWGVDTSNGQGEPYSAIHKVFPNLPKTDFSGIRYHEHPRGICSQHNMNYDLCHFDYHDIPDMGPNIAMTGFFQSWKYFEHCKDEVNEVFKLEHRDDCEHFISLHVRRGDYVQHAGSFPPITIDYIAKALLKFVDTEFRNVLVFSDDNEWCKQNLVGETIVNVDASKHYFTIAYPEYNSELTDLEMMTSCSHHIIANSSFSWWGAYLGHNPNRIVISPSSETWFGPTSGVKKPVVDLIPDSWVQIPTR